MFFRSDKKKVARLVTKLDRFNSTMVILKHCGWMPVRQLMVFQSLVLLHITVQQQNSVSGQQQPNTRQAAAAEAAILAAGTPQWPTVERCELGLKKKSWCWSAVIWYNQLPLDLRL